jgi:N-acetylglucosaminyldiphosphoundecaprenol N-acetyl-beta-D-mannosaminyltransferase
MGAKGTSGVTGVLGVEESRGDLELGDILNRASLCVPDGMSMVWAACRDIGHCDAFLGPDYMSAMCEHSLSRGYRHFLYGGAPGVTERLKAKLESRFPELRIVGTYTPRLVCNQSC